MTARQALSILSQLPPVSMSDDERAQSELARCQAIEAIAAELGFAEEAAAAHMLSKTLLARDAQQMRLFRLLGENRETEGNGHQ